MISLKLTLYDLFKKNMAGVYILAKRFVYPKWEKRRRKLGRREKIEKKVKSKYTRPKKKMRDPSHL